jgi:purine-binding chemotaxis protein CheW
MAESILDITQMEQESSLKDRYLVFNIRDEFYAIEIVYITEIVEMLPVTVVPSIPGCIVGIINLRGTIIPIMDVRMRFGYETKEYDSRTCIVVLENDDISMGVIVDSVQEVARISEDSIAKPPASNNSGANDMDYYIKGIAKWKNEIQLVIDCDKFFTLDDAGVACS